jgi:mannosyl-oligosaccharide alpha-1,2-mannosidase
MYIMGFQREFFEARDWVEDSLNFEGSKNVNLFETTIRVMGGLLSAYHLSGDQMFLKKAEQLGSILHVAFKSPSGVPYSDVNLQSRTAHGPSWNPDSTTSEVTTVQLEFRDLSRCNKKPEYEESAMNVSRHVHTLRKVHGLVPININPSTGNFRSTSVITLGARGDSYYEYLLKQWIQTGKKIDFLKDDYLLAVEGMRSKLLQRTFKSNLTFLGELEGGGNSFKPKMDHLVCYLPGTLALGVMHGLPDWHLVLAKELLYTCYLTYKRMPTGLAAEITYFRTESDSNEDFYVRSNDAHNLLRPETVESLWYLYQITGDKMYQDWGWEIFQSFMKYTRNDHGFNSISSVLHPNNVRPRDMMESFFLGETLKYFYLLFSDTVIFDLKTWVFNTEAHPFPVYQH